MTETASLREIPFTTADGSETTLSNLGDKTFLVVNVASKCGLTPQYEQLEQLQKTYGEQGLQVIGFPCNQFMGQEPGSPEEIAEFCSGTYGVTFPLTEKIEVNGEGRHPIYAELTQLADEEGKDGDIQWNFEKFLVTADGHPVARFGPRTEPDAEHVVAAIEELLG